ncbi:hypothetical protein NGRA_1012 [Nosema granulosis]|uniref:CCHC-type domain-containing protein n=1 Tax=Nosema granulosis TaxID=83296 RepID=A0A9P6KZK9_9MICR|nr:hypothetical protein NGRA_1012 [Nosema granulosis]
MGSILHIKTLARTTYESGSFLAYLDQMRRLAFKAGLPEIVLITFVLNGLPDDIGGTLLMNATDELTWAYIYNACEGLDCSNRVNTTNRVYSSDTTEVCRISREVRCYNCNGKGHVQRYCKFKRRGRDTHVREIELVDNEEGKEDINKILVSIKLFSLSNESNQET